MQSNVQYAMQPPTPYTFSEDFPQERPKNMWYRLGNMRAPILVWTCMANPYDCFDGNDKNDSDGDVDDDRKEEG